MRPPKNDPAVLALSTDAQAVLSAHWMLGKRATLTLQNQQSRLSARGAQAIAELVNARIVSDEKADDGHAESRTYRLTDYGASLEFRKSLTWMQKHGKFSITEPIRQPHD